MARSISWTDPGKLRRLLEQASRDEVPVVAARPAAANGPASSPTPSPSTRPRPQVDPFVVPAGGVDARVDALLSWIDRVADLQGVFITDAHGLAIASRGVSRDAVAISAQLIETLRGVRLGLGSGEGRLAIAIAPARILHLVGIETAWGDFAAGMVGAEFLRDEVLAGVQDALARTFGDNNDE